ncbi:MAG: leucine-rich repeat protein, partial [Muribaculaceae bacterium]|nr:leucine-rich repeat protein [Muribaculaceae bacterium]
MNFFQKLTQNQTYVVSISLVLLLNLMGGLSANSQTADTSLLEYDLNPPEYKSWHVYVKAGEASSLKGHLEVPSSHTGLNLDDKFREMPVTVIWNLSSNISSVSIPSSIKRIEDTAFTYCENLTSIVIPQTVEYVGSMAFAECPKLSSVVMSPGIESKSSFSGCKIKKGAYPIGSRYFVADIEVPYPVECIPTAEGLIFDTDKSAFYFAPWMISELELPSSVALIGDKALAGCTELNTLVIKSKIPPTVGKDSFADANIGSIIVPTGSKSNYINNADWQQFESIITEQDFPDESEKPVDPGDEAGNNELKDGSFFFGDDDKIESTLYRVISVRDKTCSLMKYGGLYHQWTGKYEIPSSVVVNGEEYKVITLGSRAYSWQTKMTEVVIPEGIVSIGEGAFIGCSALKQVVIPKSLENLDKEVFMDCESLIGINLPESLKQIGNKAFMNCTSLWRGAICGAVGDNAYTGCTALTTLDVHPSVISIGVDAFKDCTALSSVRVSDISKWFEIDFANENSNPLKYSQYLSSSNTFKPINTLTIPNEISYLKDYCLYNYTSLTELTVPQNVKSIGNMVFANCTGLEKLDLGKPLSVGENFLSGCENLTAIVLNTSPPPVCNSESFAGFNRANCLLDIPEGSKEIYLKNEEWSKFKSLKQPEEENKTEIILNHTMLTLHPKESSLLIASVNNSQTESPVLEWTSSNEKIATVSDQGMVKAVGIGTATITVTEGTVSAKCEVRVSNYEVTHIEVQPKEATLEVGESVMMVARVLPTDAPYPYLLWTSSDTSVVEIDENTGYVTAVSAGTAEIKAICQKDSGSQIFGSSIITVVPKSLVAIQLNETKLQLEQDSTFQLCATTFPDDKTDKTITWISGNEYVVKVDNTGLVTAIAQGTTYVSAWCGDVFAKCEIIVFESDVKGITLDQKELTLEGATQIQLMATVTSSDATEQVIWESSNEKVVTVDNKGLITTQAPGKAVITVSCGRYSDNCEIEVLDVEPIFSISPDEAFMKVGETLQLNVTVEPENAFNQEINFESSDERIVKVDK